MPTRNPLGPGLRPFGRGFFATRLLGGDPDSVIVHRVSPRVNDSVETRSESPPRDILGVCAEFADREHLIVVPYPLRMLISFEHRFAFIHVSKAAGSSIQRALAPYAEPTPSGSLARWRRRVGLDRLRPVERRFYREHVFANDLRRQIGAARWDELFTFVFVRNPWDWLVSMYEYRRTQSAHGQHRRVSKMTFEQYVDFTRGHNEGFQSAFVVDRAGNTIVDWIGRFERLHEDFEELAGRIGVDASLPHANRSRRKDLSAYYTPENGMVDAVADLLREDIERFGYQDGRPVQ